MTNLKNFQAIWRPKIDQQLQTDLIAISDDAEFAQMMCYAVLNGGKRLRPLLTLAVLSSFNVSVTPNLLKLATAVEWVHSYSLVHDDLPAMDNDLWRRGQPSVHAKFGESSAILVGDALLTGAFQVVSEANALAANVQKVSDEQVITIIRQLSRYAGANGMVIGQIHDMQNHGHQKSDVTYDWLLNDVYAPKTAALISYAADIGGKLSQEMASTLVHPKTQYDLYQFGYDFGLAFQIQDDIDDFDQDNDEAVDSLPHLVGMAAAKRTRNDLLADARQRLTNIAQREASFDRQLLDEFLDLIGESV
ncbi:polyprenyl synthetase family protein [Leuconostoc citreum]|jgi:geranylgeranyl diphosphate synthase type II|uniref:polyprenyl synthetase family protein n=1 Tax=Leuconostoc citreum TaxID=33964 RepID=UPI00111DE7CF|nr:polyprenyl synthetase family protein [Leuconostoc citreum]MBU7450556.1 polyprenyl synthetase family protein [Leuconostoc citreum]MCP1275373.1 polyprenyl synthetase family protein [Leuconostoc citreum]MDY5161419.1 polyprenyl synthetase family protein [Leuconostoc citreum]MDY5164972.1 polyprenyl synthetase family protein [Leuconostoc citreum]TOY70171.1 polyprenyl synthetase family protein [Leuconostoc citreum]